MVYIHRFNKFTRVLQIYASNEITHDLISIDVNNYSYHNHLSYIFCDIKENINKIRKDVYKNKKLFDEYIIQLEFYTNFNPNKIPKYYVDIAGHLIVLQFYLNDIIEKNPYNDNERIKKLHKKILNIIKILES